MGSRLIKTPVSEQALIQRINKKLAKVDQTMRRARHREAEKDLGYRYIKNLKTNQIIETHVELEPLGRQIGVLKEWEYVR